MLPWGALTARREPRALAHVIGIDMGGSHLHFALADLRGPIRKNLYERVRPEDGPRRMIQQIQRGIRRLQAQTRGSKLLALGIGVPSAVNPKTGVVAWANNLPGWRNIDLAGEIEAAFGVPVALDNDANLAAVGEHWKGVARGADNFVFVALGTGIGVGVFTDGQLYRGASGAAGELFRLLLEWERWNEHFGDTGHFESIVSGMGIAEEGRRVLPRQASKAPAGLAEAREAYFVFQAARKGNARARSLLKRTFTILGVGMANLVAVLDPELIVFGGGVARGAPEMLLRIVRRIVRRIHPESPPPIKLSSLGDKAQTWGAIHEALRLAQEETALRLG